MKADPTRRGAGRPPKGAQTADEALQAVRNGTAPARPRNAVEKEFHAGRRRRGRRPSTAARTWQAAASAEYLMRCDGLTGYAAAKLIGLKTVQDDAAKSSAEQSAAFGAMSIAISGGRTIKATVGALLKSFTLNLYGGI